MGPLASPIIAVDGSYVPAVFGIIGSLIGGSIAGFFSFLVARQAREASERLDSRQSARDL
jgi:uncharacterized membrane protein YeaQ/YmgE (transglycosylase-associated protein family)